MIVVSNKPFDHKYSFGVGGLVSKSCGRKTNLCHGSTNDFLERDRPGESSTAIFWRGLLFGLI